MTQVGPYARKLPMPPKKQVNFDPKTIQHINPKNASFTNEQLAGLSDEQLAELVKKNDKVYFGIKLSVWYYIAFEGAKIGIVVLLLFYFFYVSDSFKPRSKYSQR